MSCGICAVIAAAGMSSRMGDFKPLLPFDGSSVIRRCTENILAAGVREAVVVTGHREKEIIKELAGLGVRTVTNPDYVKTQMFDSLVIGIKALTSPCSRLILTPGDVPWVSPALIRRMLECSEEFVCPCYAGHRGHPVVLSGSRIPDLISFCGEGGLRGASKALGLSQKLVETDEIGVTIDLDTPEDYRRLKQLKE